MMWQIQMCKWHGNIYMMWKNLPSDADLERRTLNLSKHGNPIKSKSKFGLMGLTETNRRFDGIPWWTESWVTTNQIGRRNGKTNQIGNGGDDVFPSGVILFRRRPLPASSPPSLTPPASKTRFDPSVVDPSGVVVPSVCIADEDLEACCGGDTYQNQWWRWWWRRWWWWLIWF